VINFGAFVKLIAEKRRVYPLCRQWCLPDNPRAIGSITPT